jgi:hypothetical protein
MALWCWSCRAIGRGWGLGRDKPDDAPIESGFLLSLIRLVLLVEFLTLDIGGEQSFFGTILCLQLLFSEIALTCTDYFWCTNVATKLAGC